MPERTPPSSSPFPPSPSPEAARHARPGLPPFPRRRPRGAARAAGAAGVAAALALGLAGPAAAEDPPPAPVADKPIGEKFGSQDAALLAEARAADAPFVTLLIAAEPGSTGEVADRLNAVPGTSVGFTQDAIGYVRATVATGRAQQVIDEATGLSDVHAIDLNDRVRVPEPDPGAGAEPGASTLERRYPGPDADTPAANPYQPAHETGAVDFVEDNPRYDGRGITIGVLDTGVDLAHPALRETTTGEPKITDWVTATDPIVDGDASWRPMLTAVSGPRFTYSGREFTAPEGEWRINVFREAVAGGELGGDVNRDGDTTDSWALLYDPDAGTVRVDLDNDADFTDQEAMEPYREDGDTAFFGTDDPDTEISEAIPFTVEIREDVPMDPLGGDWVGQVRDFVNIGIVSGRHGTHVAGIAAANGLFGGAMNGAAPGAQIVSSRACVFAGGCTYTALFEGMIDLVVNRDVDLVNVSIGGLPALNDGNNARAHLYTALIETYGVQLFVSAGNDGPGTNTIGDPSVAEDVVSVGAAVSRETWAANYGSAVTTRYAMMPFSSAGPRDDGGFKPTLSGPGASVNTIPTWMPGSPVAEAGYDLPPGYGMLQGTSMSSPQVAGASALLLSAARQRGIELSPANLRTALTSSADAIRGVQAHEGGAGLMDTEEAWRLISRGARAHEYRVQAPVDHAMSGFLETPGSGAGVYDRETAPAVGESENYRVTVTRTTGPDRPVRHSLELVNNHDRTFRLTGRSALSLPLNEPVTLTLQARPRSLGAHSAILQVDDPATRGTDHQILATVIVPQELSGPSFAVSESGSVERNAPTSYFVRVPEGAGTLEVALGGLSGQSQTRWIALTPWGTLADDSATNLCYPHYNPANTCRPDLRSYPSPTPGVWEIEVEARRTSPVADNPYTVTATALGAAFDPETAVIEEAEAGSTVPVSWEVTNGFAPVEGRLESGELGSALTERPEIGQGEYVTREVEVPAGATSFTATLGGAADPGADLDLYVYRDGEPVGSSTSPSSDERVHVEAPEPGTYTVEVHGYAVPQGTTAFDYRDAFLSAGLGTVAVDTGRVLSLGTGESAGAAAEVTVAGPAAGAGEGREVFGEVRLLNASGTRVGTGHITIRAVTP
ncbi:S8 family serine peptidase [Streptomyces sp. DSM 44917]|uniref:S8 family serine peptidase n=1 Tax=Streptomyces boetiae TaxID=3075541 RepID=A0ABU2L4F5_9ACTN|nr:S8 family serine peptidase [Streptomyces sp. DSM 44917]MDT0306439.1 S8 family serine peptidase [Streptomyces sp. DSM 44917]